MRVTTVYRGPTVLSDGGSTGTPFGSLVAGLDGDDKVRMINTNTHGNLVTAPIPRVSNIFEEILFELKKMNIHLSAMTDLSITDGDVT